MNLNEYQEKAWETVSGNSTPNRFAHGVCAEAGEMSGTFEKFARGDFSEDQLDVRLVYEAGDVLWYLAALCTSIGIDLDHVAKLNLEKLASRARRGKIKGDGDNR